MATLLVLISSLAALLTLAPTTAEESNVLLTGDVLPTNGQLSYLDYSFVMQDDCNVVLYNQGSGWQSDTHGWGVNCTLTLNNLGQMILMTGGGRTGSAVWTSNVAAAGRKPGKYAAVLRPDGKVGVYGPEVWSTPAPGSSAVAGELATQSTSIPSVKNVLFSSQILYDGSQLASRDYTFVMKDDCNLELIKGSTGNSVTWQSGTAGKAMNCFARLDHAGQLSIVADNYTALWSSPAGGKLADYVLIMQVNGQAVVYGPLLWTFG